MRITLISDTHTKHGELTYDPKDLPGGDLLIHAGDIMNSGYNRNDILDFCTWFDSLNQYSNKVFIAGNHDRMFENVPEQASEIYKAYENITYLQDAKLDLWDKNDEQLVIYGSPWQPEFYSWAFNLPKDGPGLMSKWEAIPKDTDILITHGPAYGHLDTVKGRSNDHLGCKLLAERIERIQPKIHLCGHIHSGYGYEFKNNTHYFNVSVLDEQYEYTQKPVTFDWSIETNEITFI